MPLNVMPKSVMIELISETVVAEWTALLAAAT
jgi:hypothetical protein